MSFSLIFLCKFSYNLESNYIACSIGVTCFSRPPLFGFEFFF